MRLAGKQAALDKEAGSPSKHRSRRSLRFLIGLLFFPIKLPRFFSPDHSHDFEEPRSFIGLHH